MTAVRSRWTDAAESLRILVAPRETHRRLAGRRPILAPWLVVSAGSAVLSWFVVSLAQRASAHLLADVPDPALAETVADQIAAMQWVAVAGAPLAVLLHWSVAAALLWSVAVLSGWTASFPSVLSIVALAGLPDVLGRGVDLAVAWVEGPEFTTGLVPLMTGATSFAAVLPADGGPWAVALLDRVSPFSLWSGVLWVIGFRDGLGGSWRRSVSVCLPVWLTFAAVGAALAVLRASAGDLAGIGLPGR